MSYQLAPLILYSQDRTRLLNFLSDVFEFEVVEENSLVFHQNIFFKIVEVESKQESSSIEFSFIVKCEDDINEIVSKFNFFKYRRGENEKNISTEIIYTSNNQTSLKVKIIDIDQRPWSFEYKKAI